MEDIFGSTFRRPRSRTSRRPVNTLASERMKTITVGAVVVVVVTVAVVTVIVAATGVVAGPTRAPGRRAVGPRITVVVVVAVMPRHAIDPVRVAVNPNPPGLGFGLLL